MTPEEAIQAQLQDLAVYNSEKARGLVHTAEWVEQMWGLQEQFSRSRLDRGGL